MSQRQQRSNAGARYKIIREFQALEEIDDMPDNVRQALADSISDSEADARSAIQTQPQKRARADDESAYSSADSESESNGSTTDGKEEDTEEHPESAGITPHGAYLLEIALMLSRC